MDLAADGRGVQADDFLPDAADQPEQRLLLVDLAQMSDFTWRIRMDFWKIVRPLLFFSSVIRPSVAWRRRGCLATFVAEAAGLAIDLELEVQERVERGLHDVVGFVVPRDSQMF